MRKGQGGSNVIGEARHRPAGSNRLGISVIHVVGAAIAANRGIRPRARLLPPLPEDAGMYPELFALISLSRSRPAGAAFAHLLHPLAAPRRRRLRGRFIDGKINGCQPASTYGETVRRAICRQLQPKQFCTHAGTVAVMQYSGGAAYQQYQQAQFADYSAASYNSQDYVQRPPAYFSIDVECVATGPKHDDRDVAQISLVVSPLHYDPGLVM